MISHLLMYLLNHIQPIPIRQEVAGDIFLLSASINTAMALTPYEDDMARGHLDNWLSRRAIVAQAVFKYLELALQQRFKLGDAVDHVILQTALSI